MKILITGASGFIGSALVEHLQGRYQINILSRNPSIFTDSIYSYFWNPKLGQIDKKAFEGVSVVIHLAGESVGALWWTRSKRENILASRVEGTELLLSNIDEHVQKIISASAVGIYGDRGEILLNEQSSLGQGFLANVCRQWEKPLVASKCSYAIFRLGLVMDFRGGLLKMLRPLFRLGLGGVLGNGRQYMSWISLTDLVNLTTQAITDVKISGIINAVAPTSLTNQEFTTLFNNYCKRRGIFGIPAGVLKGILGESSSLLLASQNVVPQKLMNIDFPFKDFSFEDFLKRAR